MAASREGGEGGAFYRELVDEPDRLERADDREAVSEPGDECEAAT